MRPPELVWNRFRLDGFPFRLGSDWIPFGSGLVGNRFFLGSVVALFGTGSDGFGFLLNHCCYRAPSFVHIYSSE